MKLCWNSPIQRPTAAQIQVILSNLISSGKAVSKDIDANPKRFSQDFEQRWQNLKPNYIPKTDNASEYEGNVKCNIIASKLKTSKVADSSTIESPLGMFRSNINCRQESPRVCLKSDRDNSEELKKSEGTYIAKSEKGSVDGNVNSDIIYGAESISNNVETEVDSWLKGVEINNEDDESFVRKVSEAIRDLDAALEMEKTSSSEESSGKSSHQNSPGKDLKENSPIDSKLRSEASFKNFTPKTFELNSLQDTEQPLSLGYMDPFFNESVIECTENENQGSMIISESRSCSIKTEPFDENKENDSLVGRQSRTSSDTDDEVWRKRIERGEISEKVKEKSKSIANLMILTHIDASDDSDVDLEKPFERNISRSSLSRRKALKKRPSLTPNNFGSETDITYAVLEDEFKESLKKLSNDHKEHGHFDSLDMILSDSSRKGDGVWENLFKASEICTHILDESNILSGTDELKNEDLKKEKSGKIDPFKELHEQNSSSSNNFLDNTVSENFKNNKVIKQELDNEKEYDIKLQKAEDLRDSDKKDILLKEIYECDNKTDIFSSLNENSSRVNKRLMKKEGTLESIFSVSDVPAKEEENFDSSSTVLKKKPQPDKVFQEDLTEQVFSLNDDLNSVQTSRSKVTNFSSDDETKNKYENPFLTSASDNESKMCLQNETLKKLETDCKDSLKLVLEKDESEPHNVFPTLPDEIISETTQKNMPFNASSFTDNVKVKEELEKSISEPEKILPNSTTSESNCKMSNSETSVCDTVLIAESQPTDIVSVSGNFDKLKQQESFRSSDISGIESSKNFLAHEKENQSYVLNMCVTENTELQNEKLPSVKHFTSSFSKNNESESTDDCSSVTADSLPNFEEILKNMKDCKDLGIEEKLRVLENKHEQENSVIFMGTESRKSVDLEISAEIPTDSVQSDFEKHIAFPSVSHHQSNQEHKDLHLEDETLINNAYLPKNSESNIDKSANLLCAEKDNTKDNKELLLPTNSSCIVTKSNQEMKTSIVKESEKSKGGNLFSFNEKQTLTEKNKLKSQFLSESEVLGLERTANTSPSDDSKTVKELVLEPSGEYNHCLDNEATSLVSQNNFHIMKIECDNLLPDKLHNFDTFLNNFKIKGPSKAQEFISKENQIYPDSGFSTLNDATSLSNTENVEPSLEEGFLNLTSDVTHNKSGTSPLIPLKEGLDIHSIEGNEYKHKDSNLTDNKTEFDQEKLSEADSVGSASNLKGVSQTINSPISTFSALYNNPENIYNFYEDIRNSSGTLTNDSSSPTGIDDISDLTLVKTASSENTDFRKPSVSQTQFLRNKSDPYTPISQKNTFEPVKDYKSVIEKNLHKLFNDSGKITFENVFAVPQNSTTVIEQSPIIKPINLAEAVSMGSEKEKNDLGNLSTLSSTEPVLKTGELIEPKIIQPLSTNTLQTAKNLYVDDSETTYPKSENLSETVSVPTILVTEEKVDIPEETEENFKAVCEKIRPFRFVLKENPSIPEITVTEEPETVELEEVQLNLETKVKPFKFVLKDSSLRDRKDDEENLSKLNYNNDQSYQKVENINLKTFEEHKLTDENGKSSNENESVIIGACEDYTLDFFKGLKTTSEDINLKNKNSENENAGDFRKNTEILEEKKENLDWNEHLEQVLSQQLEKADFNDINFEKNELFAIQNNELISKETFQPQVVENSVALITYPKESIFSFIEAEKIHTAKMEDPIHINSVTNLGNIGNEEEYDNFKLRTPDDERSSDSGFRDKGSLSESVEDACEGKYNLEDIEAELEEAYVKGDFGNSELDKEKDLNKESNNRINFEYEESKFYEDENKNDDDFSDIDGEIEFWQNKDNSDYYPEISEFNPTCSQGWYLHPPDDNSVSFNNVNEDIVNALRNELRESLPIPTRTFEEFNNEFFEPNFESPSKEDNILYITDLATPLSPIIEEQDFSLSKAPKKSLKGFFLDTANLSGKLRKSNTNLMESVKSIDTNTFVQYLDYMIENEGRDFEELEEVETEKFTNKQEVNEPPNAVVVTGKMSLVDPVNFKEKNKNKIYQHADALDPTSPVVIEDLEFNSEVKVIPEIKTDESILTVNTLTNEVIIDYTEKPKSYLGLINSEEPKENLVDMNSEENSENDGLIFSPEMMSPEREGSFSEVSRSSNGTRTIDALSDITLSSPDLIPDCFSASGHDIVQHNESSDLVNDFKNSGVLIQMNKLESVSDEDQNDYLLRNRDMETSVLKEETPFVTFSEEERQLTDSPLKVSTGNLENEDLSNTSSKYERNTKPEELYEMSTSFMGDDFDDEMEDDKCEVIKNNSTSNAVLATLKEEKSEKDGVIEDSYTVDWESDSSEVEELSSSSGEFIWKVSFINFRLLQMLFLYFDFCDLEYLVEVFLFS